MEEEVGKAVEESRLASDRAAEGGIVGTSPATAEGREWASEVKGVEARGTAGAAVETDPLGCCGSGTGWEGRETEESKEEASEGW